MLFWIIIGLCVSTPSAVVLAAKRFSFIRNLFERWFLCGKSIDDTTAPHAYLLGVLGFPTFVSGLLMMIPTWFWWDFIIGFLALAALELYKWTRAKREHAELELKLRKGEAV